MTDDSIFQQKIIDIVREGSRVLDLGCGKGELLELLQQRKKVQGYGVDISFDNVLECVKRGISVFQGNIDEGLPGFSDQSFDYVILSQTLQQVHKPLFVLSEMLRVGRMGIVTFPNFAYWKVRLQLLFGDVPRTRALPYEWYDTPNIRVISIKAFRRVCRAQSIRIVAEVPLYDKVMLPPVLSRAAANLFSRKGMFVIEKRN